MIRRVAGIGLWSYAHLAIYLHIVGIRIGGDEFGMKIGFSPKLGVGFNLLGMDIFDRYRVTFDNREKKVIFESNE